MKIENILMPIMTIMTLVQAGVYKRPPPSLDGTYVLTMQKVLDQGQPIAPGFKPKAGRNWT